MVLLALVLATCGELGEHRGVWGQQGWCFLGLASESTWGGDSERKKAKLGPDRQTEAISKVLGASWGYRVLACFLGKVFELGE